MTEDQRANLEMFSPDTYGIALGKIGHELENLGWVKWVPPIFGETPTYAITDAGRAALASTP